MILPQLSFHPIHAAAQVFVSAGLPLWLAQAGAFTTDMAAIRSATERSAGGLASRLPESCDVARMKRDVCGIRLVSVPSTSMTPTLLLKDVVAVLGADFEPIRRGDLLVHNAHYHGATEPSLGVSRVVGMPGDTVELRDGAVLVNGKALAREATGETFSNDMASGTVLRETTPEGYSYSIGMAEPKPQTEADYFGPVTVPAEHYFVLGDNRYNAVDSRFPKIFNEDGFVGRSSVVGVAVSILAARDGERIGLSLR